MFHQDSLTFHQYSLILLGGEGQYPFILLGGEGHCESKMSGPRAQYDDLAKS